MFAYITIMFAYFANLTNKWFTTTTSNLGVDYHGGVTDLCYADDVAIFASMLDMITYALSAMNTRAITQLSDRKSTGSTRR